mmetsp:Transcript_3592/g.9986  ORF Transcript_3592/g.9986 Transcript_3592/m.9986 type:complete len:90 (+) Transcript_3592:16-285(+)
MGGWVDGWMSERTSLGQDEALDELQRLLDDDVDEDAGGKDADGERRDGFEAGGDREKKHHGEPVEGQHRNALATRGLLKRAVGKHLDAR